MRTVKRGREAVQRADWHLAASRCQSRKGGVNMGDSIGTNGKELWLERVENALYSTLLDTITAGNYLEADKWVCLLERLGIV